MYLSYSIPTLVIVYIVYMCDRWCLVSLHSCLTLTFLSLSCGGPEGHSHYGYDYDSGQAPTPKSELQLRSPIAGSEVQVPVPESKLWSPATSMETGLRASSNTYR